MIFGLEHFGLILAALTILIIGGWLAGHIVAGANNQREGFSRDGLEDDADAAVNLYIPPFDGDEFGTAAEEFVAQLKKRLGLNFSGRVLPPFFHILSGRAQLGDELQLVTGLVKPAQEEEALGVEESGPFFAIEGQLKGQQLEVGFFPPHNDPVGYSCTDFPLARFCGLPTKMSSLHETLLAAGTVGWLAHNCLKGDERFLDVDLLRRWGQLLSHGAHSLKVTQPLLSAEMSVVGGWCFFKLGVLEKNQGYLKQALTLYDDALEFDWRSRDVTEWAAIMSNRAAVALALASLVDGREDLYSQVLANVRDALRHFRLDNFTWRAGQLFVMATFAQEGQKTDVLSPEERHLLSRGLNKAIKFWHERDADDVLSMAYLAKGKLALQVAKSQMGLHDWERAENALLSALAACNRSPQSRLTHLHQIKFELSQLYINQASRFGNAKLLEKAVHYLSLINSKKDLVNSNLKSQVELSMALSQLHLGGINNDQANLKRAIFQFNEIRDQLRHGKNAREIDRYICVARARLALINRNSEQVKTAISQLSATLGHGGGKWPSRDVLLRLRARLRTLQFSFEGDDVALDRAIMDRRELVDMASQDQEGLRFAVEVGDLVGLLSRRQYKLDEQAQDFHEAHYLLERALAACKRGVFEDSAEVTHYDIPFIQAGLHMKMAELLASFARVKRDEKAIVEAAQQYEAFLDLSPRSTAPLARASALNEIGQIMMDRSEQYGHHDGLIRAAHCFAESYDLYLNAGLMDQANRQRRFLENAEAAIVAYKVPHYDPLTAHNVVVVRPNLQN